MNKWTEVRNKRKATSPIVNCGKESRSKLSEGTMADKEETREGLSLTGGTINEADISQGSGSASGFLSAKGGIQKALTTQSQKSHRKKQNRK